MNDQCLFCKIVRREVPSEIIYENEFTLAFLDVTPNANGHTLVIPKKHSVDFSSTTNDDLIEVTKTKKIVAKMLLNSDLKPKGINYISNQGSEAFQQIFHYHEHLIPKYKRNEGFRFDLNPVDLLNLNEVYKIIKK